MRIRTSLFVALFVGPLVALSAAKSPTVQGVYAEARTAEVFAGACVVNGEADTTGREALLAWKVTRGQVQGVSLDGLAVVAAVAADVNLGIHEIGGPVPRTRTVLFVDSRASQAQRQALVGMVKALSPSTVGPVVETKPAAIQFVTDARNVRVATTGLRLVVQKELDHDPLCGNKQWFGPLTTVQGAELGTTVENAFSGGSLGTTWSDPNKRSAFFGTFAY
jgi:hypothetical protein